MSENFPILVVDDSAAMRQTVKSVLIARGYDKIEMASNGTEALQKCAEASFKIVFLDWNMPGVDGMSFLQSFRSNTANQKSAVVMLTALSDKKSVIAAMEAGATYYMTKPVSTENIQKKLEQAIEWVKTQEALP